jgi:hypothetical protein
MVKRYYPLTLILVLLYAGVVSAQAPDTPILDKIANKVIQKYQQSSCQDLVLQKSQPPTGQKARMEERAIQLLHNDPQLRTQFLNQVAGPIANKMFECGMIP